MLTRLQSLTKEVKLRTEINNRIIKTYVKLEILQVKIDALKATGATRNNPRLKAYYASMEKLLERENAYCLPRVVLIDELTKINGGLN
jgi:ribosomal protein S24E